jgi:hypothetical protein
MLLLFSYFDRINKVARPLRLMAIKTSAFLLSLADFLSAPVQNQVFPITGLGTEAFRSFDHHGQKLRLLIVFLIEFFPDDNRTGRKHCGLGRAQRVASEIVDIDDAVRTGSLMRRLVAFGANPVSWLRKYERRLIS